ncbi:MAG: 2-C-methyl-D-erythritol 4-phosphate cytidylyltransferase [Bacteroidia bacterium]|nr:MAG: 2-C-methyl-D-erythritol 4-phosphate cytidylyltransferase [Bacteroidia bacterium]
MKSPDDFHKYLVVVAGGKGTRMGSSIPKQFMTIAGRPILMHAVDSFVSAFPGIDVIIVLDPAIFDMWGHLCQQHSFTVSHHLVAGGEERFISVRNGLSMVSRDSLIAIHDGVRPFVSGDTIRRCFDGAARYGNAVPVISPSESVRQLAVDGNSHPVNRDTVKLVQTPQVFRSDILLKAYATAIDKSFTDDATVVESAGEKIRLVDGNRENIKITTPADMIIGEGIYKLLKGSN